MTHTVTYNSTLHIVESKLQGNMTLGEVDEIITKTAKIAKENDCRLIFNDFREVSRKLSILQIYELPDRIRTIFTSFGINVGLYKRANVVAKDWDEYIFHEMSWSIVDKKKRCLLIWTKQRNGYLEKRAQQSQICPCSGGYYPNEKRP